MKTSIGRIVIYSRSGEGAEKIIERPAVVVRVMDQAKGVVNLHVFNDGQNDDDAYLRPAPIWRGAVRHSETPEHDSWRWPERV